MGDAFGVGLDPLLRGEPLMSLVTSGLGEIRRSEGIDIDGRPSPKVGLERRTRLREQLEPGEFRHEFPHPPVEVGTVVVQNGFERRPLGIRPSIARRREQGVELTLGRAHGLDHGDLDRTDRDLETHPESSHLRHDDIQPEAVGIGELGPGQRIRIGLGPCDLGGECRQIAG